jgi:ABC-type transporter Mla subunit MlaD
LPVAGPRQLRNFAADGVDAGRRLLTLLPRFESLLDTAEEMLAHVSALVERMDRTEATARRVVTAVDSTHEQVRKLIDDNAAAGARVVEALDTYLPSLEPVASDLRELLTSSRALNEIIGTVPGLGRAKKRAEEQLETAEDGGA